MNLSFVFFFFVNTLPSVQGLEHFFYMPYYTFGGYPAYVVCIV